MGCRWLGVVLLCAGCAAAPVRGRPAGALWRVAGPCHVGERRFWLSVSLAPGRSVARVWSGTRLVRAQRLALGPRAWPDGVALVSGRRVAGAPGGSTLLVIHDAGLRLGEGNTQSYGLTGSGRLVLLRLEAGGAARANVYTPKELIGPPPPIYTRGSLLAALGGGDRALALEALGWLGGGPASGRGPSWDALSRDPEVRRRLEALTRSGTGWIAEAAALALRRAPGS